MVSSEKSSRKATVLRDIDDELRDAATKIQASWRGYKTRRYLCEVQLAYVDIMHEIDGLTEGQHVIQQDKIFRRPCVGETRAILEVDHSTASSVIEESYLESEETFSTQEPEDDGKTQPNDHELLRKKKDIAMELFWVQQAIESRRNYLLLKNNMQTS